MVRGDMLQGKTAGAVPSSAPVAAGANAHWAGPNANGAPRNANGAGSNSHRADKNAHRPGRNANGADENVPGAADPAWTRVLAIALILAVVVAAGVSLAVSRSRPGAGPGAPGEATASKAVSPGGIGPAAVARAAAAAWAEAQVSRSAVVACDPPMCFALQGRGFPAANLMQLNSAAAYPLGATVIIATAAVRNQFGSRLDTVYAPVVIASFGRGQARVDIRAYAAGSAPAYRAALAADFAARQAAGRRLLGSAHIAAPAAARRDLAAGAVDSRLLITLATLAARQDVRIVAFGSADPHGDAQLPLRSAELAMPRSARPGGTAASAAYLQSVLTFLRTQLPPALAARTRLVHAGGATILQVGFAAPTPLGLLETHFGYWK
jgi:hypothetical protein